MYFWRQRACLWELDSGYLQQDKEVAERSSVLAQWLAVVLVLECALERLTAAFRVEHTK